MIYNIHSENPQERLIKKAVDVLKQGGLIVYPTDTFYGICCDINERKAVEKLHTLKQGKKNKHLSIIFNDLKHISEYAFVSTYSYRTMKRLLPGPYTFILEATKVAPKILLTKQKTVGIRIPSNKICEMLIESLGNPIVSTTANLPDFGDIISTPDDFNDHFKHRIDLIIDGGPAPCEPSAVVSLVTDPPEIIREGLGDTSIFE